MLPRCTERFRRAGLDRQRRAEERRVAQPVVPEQPLGRPQRLVHTSAPSWPARTNTSSPYRHRSRGPRRREGGQGSGARASPAATTRRTCRWPWPRRRDRSLGVRSASNSTSTATLMHGYHVSLNRARGRPPVDHERGNGWLSHWSWPRRSLPRAPRTVSGRWSSSSRCSRATWSASSLIRCVLALQPLLGPLELLLRPGRAALGCGGGCLQPDDVVAGVQLLLSGLEVGLAPRGVLVADAYGVLGHRRHQGHVRRSVAPRRRRRRGPRRRTDRPARRAGGAPTRSRSAAAGRRRRPPRRSAGPRCCARSSSTTSPAAANSSNTPDRLKKRIWVASSSPVSV